VEPGFFAPNCSSKGSSTIWPERSTDDYAPRTAATIEVWTGMNGQQPGDRAKLAQAKARELLAQADACPGLGGNLTYDQTHTLATGPRTGVVH
jgi:hypothetical protein